MGFLSGFKQKIVSWVAILGVLGGGGLDVVPSESIIPTVVMGLISLFGREAFERYVFPILQALAFLVLHHPDKDKVPATLRKFLEGLLNAVPPAAEPVTITGSK